ncbi:MAG: hypothetical protein H0Z33_13930 [Bacillaceae bacterium]|nr:hypothetical protein [Bacillaceae bacterium]
MWDDKWGLYDAVSVSAGTLMFARMLPDIPQRIRNMVEEPYNKAMEFIIERQGKDGEWEYKEKYETPVCVTAHLLQKTLGYDKKGVKASKKAVQYLVKTQHPEGHYDNMNVDHTCDSIRALILASELLDDYSWHNTIEKGFKWLMSIRNDDDSWGDFPGEESNMLILCDVLDTILKYKRFVKLSNLSLRRQ